MLRLAARIGALALAGLVLYVGVTATQVLLASRRDEKRPVDAIVVFGAAQYDGRPSPVLRARLDHAIELRGAGYARTIVVTGGRRAGDRYTEAGASARYLEGHGVPDADILREVHGHNSWQSLAAAARFLKSSGKQRVLLVSDPMHASRIRRIGRDLGLGAFVSPARGLDLSAGATLRYWGRETVAVAVGRVVGFERLTRLDRSVSRVGFPTARSGVV